MAAGDRPPDTSKSEIKVGSRRQQSGLAIESIPGTRGYFKLTAGNGLERFFWLNDSGVLIVSTTLANVIAGTGTAV